MFKKDFLFLKNKKVMGSAGVLVLVFAVGTIAVVKSPAQTGNKIENKIENVIESNHEIEVLAAGWPECFVVEPYEEPPFVDDENRENNAFNVADFGEQGSNGWFYRYGDSAKPTESRQIENYNGDRYFQQGATGLEIKKDFLHTGDGVSAILEWRAAKTGKVNIELAYVKSVNGDKNPTFPDGVRVHIYKGEELLESHSVDIATDKENVIETNLKGISLEENESLYFVVDPQSNHAYDGGQLYVAIVDENAKAPEIAEDTTRKDNNANNIKDFGEQGKNGWFYMCGKDIKNSQLASCRTEDGYLNFTSPGLMIKKDFIHPAINDNAILGWAPKQDGTIEIRGKYTKFEQKDGNPNWPDGVIVQGYLNDRMLFEKEVKAPSAGTNVIEFREQSVKVTKKDRLYFVVKANGNSSYDGGCLDVSIMDRNGMADENSVKIDETEIRQNNASAKDDFGEQGKNGWFYQEGYQDQPFGAYNIKNYIKDDKYVDENYLEIKRDYVNPGDKGESAVIKWKVAQTGKIKIDASYTKLKNEDKNPSWPDGTRVTLYHNNTKLVRQEFEPNVSKEITKDLNVKELSVNKGDFITMVVNGKENMAYDGGKYTFNISSLSGIAGTTEKDVQIPNDDARSNNASMSKDFGKQGANGWFYQYGYNNDPFCAVNIENFDQDKYITKDGIEIKRDYIVPSTNGKTANVKWKAAKTGVVDVYVNYTKLLNEDKNPSWPDGTVVMLMHNGKLLKQESFAPDTKQEITKDLNVSGLHVNEGDFITLIVNGKENSAYDGGLYSFSIEDASETKMEKTNTSKKNVANLESDFGEQGSNGWYYLDGRSIEKADVLSVKTEDQAGYLSEKAENLEVRKDFVQPGADRDAMYQWIVAEDGEIHIVGQYTKYGQNDNNPSWPDGTTVSVYKNNTLLFDEKVEVFRGDGNNNTINFDLKNQKVKKGDQITFVIGAVKNNAWDGGKLSVRIKPQGEEIVYVSDKDNEANLFENFGEQGSNGWYYGMCEWDASNFELLDYNAQERRYYNAGKPELKADFVEPGAGKNAAYMWVAAKDGKIQIQGKYTKFANSADAEANGVCLRIFQNEVEKRWIGGEPIQMGGITGDAVVEFDQELEVKKGDRILFAVNPEGNDAWDGGRLAITIDEVN